VLILRLGKEKVLIVKWWKSTHLREMKHSNQIKVLEIEKYPRLTQG